MIAPASINRTPIDDYLERQQLMTPVAEFSRKLGDFACESLTSRYQQLIPLSQPKPGEQYAFQVDMDVCSGCKACVTACHSLNGLSESESWRDVGMLVGGESINPYLQTVTTACHHCLDPGCLNGCPVKAYEKDPGTGIVHHLDDQCIGCEYCVMKCPYSVPKYNPALGIVRKCDMCHNRLAEGEAPACVQACPTQAISITIATVDDVEASSLANTRLVPGAPDSRHTKPTTQFVTNRPLPSNTMPANHSELRLEPAHYPLIFMLTLTQAAVGIVSFEALLRMAGKPVGVIMPATALVLGLTGLTASVFHLGRPLKAWRFFLGLKTSWLSREILVFSIFGATLPLYVLSLVWPGGIFVPLNPVLLAATVVSGLAGVYCSARIYEDTQRPFWRARYSLGGFFGTVVSIGAASCLPSDGWAVPVIGITLFRLAWELTFFRHLASDSGGMLGRSARILWFLLRPALATRLAAGSLGGIVIPALMLANRLPFAWGMTMAMTAILAGEWLHHYLFFRAVVPFGMPGGLTTHDPH